MNTLNSSKPDAKITGFETLVFADMRELTSFLSHEYVCIGLGFEICRGEQL